ncbi:uncharacterized protein LAESUDRAFT_601853, partial [Laetiporus sulphureus 93-53]
LIFYEYIVTFPQEVHVIWGARLTTVTIIFAINRYMLMVQGVMFALSSVFKLWHAPLVSHAQVRDCLTSNFMKRLIGKWLGFAAFRTYAISRPQVVPALLVLLLGLAQVSGYYIVNLATVICPAIADLIVVLVTWYKTFRLAVEVRKLRIKGSIATMLLRDG